MLVNYTAQRVIRPGLDGSGWSIRFLIFGRGPNFMPTLRMRSSGQLVLTLDCPVSVMERGKLVPSLFTVKIHQVEILSVLRWLQLPTPIRIQTFYSVLGGQPQDCECCLAKCPVLDFDEIQARMFKNRLQLQLEALRLSY